MLNKHSTAAIAAFLTVSGIAIAILYVKNPPKEKPVPVQKQEASIQPDAGCDKDDLGCTCTGNNTCNRGLRCENGICAPISPPPEPQGSAETCSYRAHVFYKACTETFFADLEKKAEARQVDANKALAELMRLQAACKVRANRLEEQCEKQSNPPPDDRR